MRNYTSITAVLKAGALAVDGDMPRYICLRPVFKVQSGQMGPAPGRFDLSEGMFEVSVSNGSGI